MNKMYEILEKCLVEIEQGADVDTVLFRYPEYAKELRPILETSIKAKNMAAPEPSFAMVHINRTKILQHAAELREAKVKRSSRFWFASLRRVAVTFIVLIALFASGNGLVRASSNTIPGDNLYPVKRTWEDVLVLFTFNTQQREELEIKHENERLEELNELFTEGRAVKVDFAGYVTRQNGNEWRVSAITVLLTPQTDVPNAPVSVGDGVRIVGLTQSDKTVLAERIDLLSASSKLPEVQDTESEPEEEIQEGSTPQVDEGSNSGSENEAPQIEVIETPDEESTRTPNVDPTHTPKVEATSEQKSVEFEGVLQSFNNKNNIWVISGRSINVGSAKIEGTPAIGATAKVKGYRDTNGVFVVTKVEVSGGSGGDENDSNSNNTKDNSNDGHGGNGNSNSGGDD